MPLRILILGSFFAVHLAAHPQATAIFDTLPPALFPQPDLWLDRAERLGWMEQPEYRTESSSRFTTPEGAVMVFASVNPVNYTNADGVLVPYDPRPVKIANGYLASQQPMPVFVNNQGAFSILPKAESTPVPMGLTLTIDGQQAAVPPPIHDRQHLTFANVTENVDKHIEFRYGALKYAYVLHAPPGSGAHLYRIEEHYGLPAGYRPQLRESQHPLEPAVELLNERGDRALGVHPLICRDAAGSHCIGEITFTHESETGFTLQLNVSRDWLLANERTYPVVIDPLVTGPTSTFPAVNIPSCFFPDFSIDSLSFEVPGEITITNMNVTSNFFASPFTTSVMGDGRMFFSTECGNTVTYQITGETALQPGTAYLEDFNMNSPLMCCKPQQCDGYTMTMYKHLSRTSNGNACNSQFIYYDPTSLWPFSVFIEGHTAELYGNEMQFTPSTLCSNVCEVDARIFARYGVPPYTFTHPWSDETIEWGNAQGCNPGQVNRVLSLGIDDCPVYCDLTPFLQVPPPIVTDQCGNVAFTETEFFTLNLKPAPEAPPSQTLYEICSGDELSVNWEPCLEGTTVIWNGNGWSEANTGFTVTLDNTTDSPIIIPFSATASLDGCESESEPVEVVVYPNPNVQFSANPSETTVASPISFADETQYFGSTPSIWNWNFGGSGFADESEATFSFTSAGEQEVCLSITTEIGCEQTHCETLLIAPAELVLPNIITPNNDGVNDFLFIEFIEQFPGNRIEVYNRWGTPVFEADNYRNNWRADDVSDGAYYYIVHVPGRDPVSQTLQITRTRIN
jgi:gliding motility-associated-like protein